MKNTELKTLCENYLNGTISNFELVLKLQQPPEVVTRMLQAQKLPYQASRKIEIQDLLHDDPRIEVAAQTPHLNYSNAIRRKMKLDGYKKPFIKNIYMHDSGFIIFHCHRESDAVILGNWISANIAHKAIEKYVVPKVRKNYLEVYPSLLDALGFTVPKEILDEQ